MRELIRLGDEGSGVRDIQERLERVLAEPVRADGVFGPQTRDAVRRFQRERGLASDGVVGPETWRSLDEAGRHLGERLLWYARSMMRGDDVRELQHRLNLLGFDAGAEDGIFGPLASAAVEEFQRNVGLEVDGVAGPLTVDALRRLHRTHQRGGHGARELELLRRLRARGLTGARVLVDPARGEGEPGQIGPSGVTEADLNWRIASRLVARLAARGVHVLVSRGPTNNPSPTARARLANDSSVDLVLSIAMNGPASPRARGSSTYYFGSATFTSEGGYRLAERVQESLVAAGWLPDGRTHPMTWAILRETRMPAVVAQPGYLTAVEDERRLACDREQDRLSGALTEAVARFFHDPAVAAAPRLAVPQGV